MQSVEQQEPIDHVALEIEQVRSWIRERKFRPVKRSIKYLVLQFLRRHRRQFETKQRIDVVVQSFHQGSICIVLRCAEEIFCEEQRTLLRRFFTNDLPGAAMPILELRLGWTGDVRVTTNPHGHCTTEVTWTMKYRPKAPTAP